MEQSQSAPELNIGEATHEGMSGKQNEDNYGCFCWKVKGGRKLHLGVVADGIGGQTAGELASRLAVEAVEDYFKEQDSQLSSITAHLERAILKANLTVYQHSQDNPQYQGMGTTMVMAVVVDGRLYTSYVGDSRIYLLRDGRMRQITIDHTWAQEAIEVGLLTREQAKTHPNRNVIKRFLGGSPEVAVDCRLVLEAGESTGQARANQGFQLQPGDTILLCSDGLSDMIDDAAILDSLQTHFHDLPTAATELVDKANAAGGKDNITLVIMQVPGGRGVAAMPLPVQAVTEKKPVNMSKWGVPLLLAGGGFLSLIFVVALGAIFLLNRNNDRNANSTPLPAGSTTVPLPSVLATTDQSIATSEGPPATAALLLPVDNNSNDTPEAVVTAVDTPALIPTLQPTSTPTRIPPTRTPVATATTAPTFTPVPPQPGPAPTNPPAPQPTNPPPPTPEPPPPTATPEPDF